jgi:hypothetical protein
MTSRPTPLQQIPRTTIIPKPPRAPQHAEGTIYVLANSLTICYNRHGGLETMAAEGTRVTSLPAVAGHELRGLEHMATDAISPRHRAQSQPAPPRPTKHKPQSLIANFVRLKPCNPPRINYPEIASRQKAVRQPTPAATASNRQGKQLDSPLTPSRSTTPLVLIDKKIGGLPR